MNALRQKEEPWRSRLYLPNYNVGEAARYARVSAQTVSAWHKASNEPLLSRKDDREALSYMQLIEVAVVAKFRAAGITIAAIKKTREYLAGRFNSKFPFAEYKFKTDGKSIFMDYDQIVGKKGAGTFMRPDRNGQLAWEIIIGRLEEFEYEHKGIVIRWHLAGLGSPIMIDPRVAFGAPQINGTPTWTIKGRWDAGENLEDIADDFGLEAHEVRRALEFEGAEVGTKLWKQ
ncbi:DUF433 domain-containing protein [Methylobacterium radiodurans]|uniref:DUF433 domain-containing protein n=1 Tax=Methylobacterium radiodurans TaxID=2202828 RepID=A0A2U8VNM1_9HYPH|nr:DUF433 domain-containing protein [Methylobacterium radiodurans]AWN35213.1 hypothetical protein DK427_05240 [Methylobacterium radiodurans]